MKEIGRNDPCPCGSGKKFKKCCALKTPMQRRTFTVIDSPKTTNSMSHITSMVSKNLHEVVPEEVEKLDRKVEKETANLEGRITAQTKDDELPNTGVESKSEDLI